MGADENQIVNKSRDEVRAAVRSRYHIPSDAFLLVTGGKLDQRKQQDLLLEAARHLADENIFLLVFGIPSDEMKDAFAAYANDSNVVQVGWVHSDDIYNLFLASDLAVFPGTHSVLWEEAVACALPILIRHWSGMEHVNYCGNAMLLDDVSVETLVEAIRTIMDTDCYQAMKRAAIEAAPFFYLRDIALRSVGLLF